MAMYMQCCSRPECRSAADPSASATAQKLRNKACIQAHEDERKRPAAQQAPWVREQCKFSRPLDGLSISVMKAPAELAGLQAEAIFQQGKDAGLYADDPEPSKTGIHVAANSKTHCSTVQHGQTSAIELLLCYATVISAVKKGLAAAGDGAAAAAGVPGKTYTMVADMVRLRWSLPQKDRKSRPTCLLTRTFMALHHRLEAFLTWPFTTLGYIMTCSLHCDDNSAGYYQRGMRECLTIFCDMPVVVMVVYTDFVYDKSDTAAVEFFTLHSGDTLVMEGAAGQAFSHVVFAKKGHHIVRFRTFWAEDA